MRKIILCALCALPFASCHESLEERAAHEAEEFTRKNCPVRISEFIVNDSMGYDKPKVGVLAAVEKVNPKQPETVDAAKLTEMCKNGEIKDCLVEGPLSYDILMSKDSAAKKGFTSELVGDADVLLVPDMPCGNILAKALLFSAGADMAGLIVGAKVPIALTSRGATEKEKRQSLLLAAACAKGGK